MAQLARPDGNVTQTSFTGGFAEIDEATASDTDFAYGANNTAAVLEVSLGNVTDPASSTGHTFRYRVAKVNAGVLDNGGSAVTVTAELYQGATLIAADTARTATGTWTEYALTLTGGQADSITNYNDLRLRFTTSASGGSPANRRGGAVSWAELELPDAPTGITATLTVADSTSSAQGVTANITANAPVALADSAASAQDVTGAVGGIAATTTPADALAEVWDVDALASGIFVPVAPADANAAAQSIIAQLQGMGAQMAVGSFQVTSADSTSKNISGLQWSGGATGVTPQLIFLFASSLGSSNEENSHVQASTGVTDGTRSFTMARTTRDGATTATASQRGHWNNRILSIIDYGGTVQAAFSLGSFGSDQFTLTTITTPTGMNHYVRYVAFAGLDNAYVDVVTETAGTGNKSLSNAGFRPDAIFWMSSTQGSTGMNNVAANVRETMGWSLADGTQFAVGRRYIHNVTADYLLSAVATDRVLFLPNAAGAGTIMDTTLVSHDTNGVTYTQNIDAGSLVFCAVHIKGGKWKAGTFAAHSAAEQFDVNTSGVNPVGFFLMASNAHTASRSSPYEVKDLSVGAATARDQWAIQHYHHDVGTVTGPNGTEEYTIMPTNRVWTHSTRSSLDTLTKVGDISRVSLGSNKFTLEQMDGDPTAILIGYLAFGNAPPAITATAAVAEAIAAALGVTGTAGASTALTIATATAEAIDIDVTAGLTAALSAAIATATSIDLTVLSGGVTTTLTVATATAEAVNITVIVGGITATLTVAVASSTANDISVALGGIIASLSVSTATGQAIDVSGVLGGIVAQLIAADALSQVTDVNVTMGGASATLTITEAVASADGVTAALGGVTAELTIAEAAGQVLTVTVASGGITATLTHAEAIAQAIDVAATIGGAFAPLSIAQATAEATTITVTLGGVVTDLTIAEATATAQDVAAFIGGTIAALSVAQAVAESIDISVTEGGIVTVLAVSIAQAQALDVAASGTVPATLGVADAQAESIDVTAWVGQLIASLTIADADAEALGVVVTIVGGVTGIKGWAAPVVSVGPRWRIASATIELLWWEVPIVAHTAARWAVPMEDIMHTHAKVFPANDFVLVIGPVTGINPFTGLTEVYTGSPVDAWWSATSDGNTPAGAVSGSFPIMTGGKFAISFEAADMTIAMADLVSTDGVEDGDIVYLIVSGANDMRVAVPFTYKRARIETLTPG